MHSNFQHTPCIVHIEDSDSDAQFFDYAVSAIDMQIIVKRFGEWKKFEEYANNLTDDPTLPLPDLFIMDHDVDGTDAMGLINYIRKNETLALVPIIVFSGYDFEDAINSYYLAGASSYIRKPQSIDEMVVIMKSVVQYWFTINRGPVTKNRM